MGGTYTKAQKKATEKYQKSLASLSIRIDKEQYQDIKAAAEREGAPLRQFVLAAIWDRIKKNERAAADQEKTTE